MSDLVVWAFFVSWPIAFVGVLVYWWRVARGRREWEPPLLPDFHEPRVVPHTLRLLQPGPPKHSPRPYDWKEHDNA